jgi:Yip1 domain
MTLKYLVTILLRPRATMRRILANSSRWEFQVVALAAICTSVNEADSRAFTDALPSIRLMPGLAIAAVGLVAQALSWILLLLILSWIAAPVGRLLGGIGKVRDVRAAMAWAMVPMIWSALYRIPFTIMASGLHSSQRQDPHKLIAGFISHGGCSLIVVYLFLQFIFELACIVIGCFTVAEAQKFSAQKGFLNIAITLVLPVLIVVAAVMSLRS